MPVLDNLMGLTERDSTLVMSGERDELLQKCCDALEATPRFSVVTVSAADPGAIAITPRQPGAVGVPRPACLTTTRRADLGSAG